MEENIERLHKRSRKRRGICRRITKKERRIWRKYMGIQTEVSWREKVYLLLLCQVYCLPTRDVASCHKPQPETGSLGHRFFLPLLNTTLGLELVSSFPNNLIVQVNLYRLVYTRCYVGNTAACSGAIIGFGPTPTARYALQVSSVYA
jgi:hypothetical protein